MKILKMTIGGKLIAAFSLVLFFLLLTTALGIYRLWESQSQIEKIIGVNNAKVKLTLSMRDTVYERMLAIRTAALVGETGKMQVEAERIAKEEEKYKKISTAFTTTNISVGITSDEKVLLQLIQNYSDQCAPLIKQSIEFSLAGQDSMAYDLLTDKIIPLQAKWMKALSDLISLEDKFSEQEALHSEVIFKETLLWLLALGALALLSGIVVAFSLTKHITKQLGGEPGYAVSVAERISAGDLATDIAIKKSDKESLLYAMRCMLLDLRNMISIVRRDCDHIALSSTHIAHGNFDLSNRTEKQTKALEQTATIMDELTSTVKENAISAQQANDKAISAVELAEQGGRAVTEVVNTMSSISSSSRKVVDIIDVIDSIAFQTNILALNAAVEAARAGTHGSGFAVVASEVRNLAQRSSSAAKEIAALIKASNQQIETGNDLAAAAGKTMEEIVSSIHDVLGTIRRISIASSEQSEKILLTNEAVSRLDQMTQENVTLVETIANSAEELQDRTKKVAETMSVFKIEHDTYQESYANAPLLSQ